ncbi:hypothetical protein [Nonomuraea endophytica]|uniref:hypothetical protein n=1 Tax=Nonomuraea endophytica TaxID=714136 RepID=UPI0037CB78DA
MPTPVDPEFAELKAILFPDPDTVFPDVWYTPLWQQRFRLLATVGVPYGSLNYLALKLGLDQIPADVWGPQNTALYSCAVLARLRLGLNHATSSATAEQLAWLAEPIDPPPAALALPPGEVHRYGR